MARRTREIWKNVIGQFERSGKTQEAFATEREIPVGNVTAEDADCPKCGDVASRPVGAGKETFVFEYVPGYFVRQKHVQEKLACSCGEYIATAARRHGRSKKASRPRLHRAPGGDEVQRFVPPYRLAKQYQRLGYRWLGRS